MSIAYFLLAGVALYCLYWYLFARSEPKYPPLEISDSDPRMQAAIRKARDTIDRLRDLLESDHSEAQVKVAFESNSGETEHLWAEVLELQDSDVKVRYLTPPVTHTGTLERVHLHDVCDIEDWAVILESGEIYGGYTQRVMFDVAREQYGELPSELAEQASRYTA